MNFLFRILASEQRDNPFKTWQYDSVKNQNDFLRFSFKHFKRDHDFSQMLLIVTNPQIALIRIEHAFYLGLQGESTESIQKNLKGFSKKAMSNFAKLLEFFEEQFSLGGESKSPLEYVLRELIKNALEGSIRQRHPDFIMRPDKIEKVEYEKLLTEKLLEIEKNHSNIMKFYISLAPRFNAQGKKTPHITFFIISPQMNEHDHLRLRNKIEKYSQYKLAGKTFNDYLTEEYELEVEAQHAHGLGTISLLNIVDNYWQGRARVEFNIDDKKTQIGLAIEIQ